MRATISYLGVLLWLPAMVAASSSHPLPREEKNKSQEDVTRKLVSDTEGTEGTAGVGGTGSQSVLLEADGSVSNEDGKKVKWEVVEDEEVQESETFICSDEPGWIVSATKHNQAMEPFLNMTCDQLELTIDESGHEEWCNFHRSTATGGKSAFEACCFCGGGSHVPVPCSDYPNWTLDPSGSNTIIDCEFVAEQQELCSVMKDVIGYGVSTVQDACCACGGGFRPFLTDYVSIIPLSKDTPMPTLASSSSPTIVPSQMPSKSTKSEKVNPLFPDQLENESPTTLNSSSPSINTDKSSKSDKSNKSKRKLKHEEINGPSPRRKLLLGDPPFESPPKFEDDIPSSMYSRNTDATPAPATPAPSPATPASKKVPDIRDWTTRGGLGESPGINNLEFLGLGYDGLQGNPRGSLTSELDPGKSKSRI